MNAKRRNILFGLIILLHLIFVFISMGQPFHGDEVIIPEAAKGVLKTGGVPVLDYGDKDNGFEQSVHIPLYVYIMSFFIFLFGYNIYSIRAVGAIFNLLTIGLVYLITKELLKDYENKEGWALAASFLYALNPLTIQSSILIDIDGGLLNFSIHLFLYALIKTKKLYYLIPALVLVFLSKLVGPPLIFIALIVCFFITSRYRKVFSTGFLFLTSGIIALGMWWGVAKVVGANFLMSIQHNSVGGVLHVSLFRGLIAIWQFKNFVYFAIPFFILLFLVLSFIFYKKLIKNRGMLKDKLVRKALLFNVFALVVILFYLYSGGSAWGFPKYQIIALPSMCIFIVYILSKSNISLHLENVWKTKKGLLLILTILLSAYFLVFVSDPLIQEFDSAPQNINIQSSILAVLKSALMYILIPFGICFGFFSLSRTKSKFWISLIFLILFLFAYINIFQASVDYSTYSKYGDEGVLEVVEYIKKNNIPASAIASQVHIGSYLDISEYREISFIYNDPEKFRKDIVEDDRIKYIITWERDIARMGEDMKFFTQEKIIGSYYIFKKK